MIEWKFVNHCYSTQPGRTNYYRSPMCFWYPGDLAPSAQSMIFLANRNPYQHALQAQYKKFFSSWLVRQIVFEWYFSWSSTIFWNNRAQKRTNVVVNLDRLGWKTEQFWLKKPWFGGNCCSETFSNLMDCKHKQLAQPSYIAIEFSFISFRFL